MQYSVDSTNMNRTRQIMIGFYLFSFYLIIIIIIINILSTMFVGFLVYFFILFPPFVLCQLLRSVIRGERDGLTDSCLGLVFNSKLGCFATLHI